MALAVESQALTPQIASPLVPAESMRHTVEHLALGQFVLLHNGPVYAILGNANSPSLLNDLQTIKDDPTRSAVGWTAPFKRRVMDMVDTKSITNKPIRDMLNDPNGPTKLWGALGFLCMPAKARVLHDSIVPAGLVSREFGTVQPYSPTGYDFMSKLIRVAEIAGRIEPVITSANFHNEREITNRKDAEDFVETVRRRTGHTLPIIEPPVIRSAAQQPLGSFPIVRVHSDHLALARTGWMRPELAGRIFAGYDIDLKPANQRDSAYPDSMVGIEDLPERYQHLTGAQLRLGILATLGWNAEAKTLLDEQLVDS